MAEEALGAAALGAGSISCRETARCSGRQSDGRSIFSSGGGGRRREVRSRHDRRGS
jgi:hypothetical protein